MKGKFFIIIILSFLLSGTLLAAQDFKTALAKADSIKAANGQYDERYLDALTDAIQIPFQAGDFKTALTYRKQHCELVRTKNGEVSDEYAEDLVRLGNVERNLYGNAVALRLYRQAHEIYTKTGGDLEGFHDLALSEMLNYYTLMEDVENLYKYALEFLDFLDGACQPARYVFIADVAGNALNDMGDFGKARTVYEKGCSAKAPKEVDPLYSQNLAEINLDYGLALSSNGEKSEAIKHKWAAYELSKGKDDDVSVQCYLNSVTSLGMDYFAIGDQDNAYRCFSESIPAMETYCAGNLEALYSEDLYRTSLQLMCSLMAERNEKDGIWAVREKWHDAMKASGTDNTGNFCINAQLLMDHYIEIGDYGKAKEVGTILEDRMQPLVNKTSDTYFRFLHSAIQVDRATGDGASAMSHVSEMKRAAGECGNDVWMAQSLFNEGAIHYDAKEIGKVLESSRACREVILKLGDTQERDELSYACQMLEASALSEVDPKAAIAAYAALKANAISFGNEYMRAWASLSLGNCYLKLSDFVNASAQLEESKKVFEACGAASDPTYFFCLNSYAICRDNMGHFAEARNILEAGKAKAKEAFGNVSPVYMLLLSNSIDGYKILKDYEKAMAEAIEYNRIAKQLYSEDNEQVIMSECQLADIGLELDDLEKALNRAKRCVDWVKAHPEVNSGFCLNCYETLAEAYEVTGNRAAAVNTYKEGYEATICKVIPNIESLAELNRTMGDGKQAFQTYLTQQGKTEEDIINEMNPVLPRMLMFLFNYGQYDGIIDMIPVLSQCRDAGMSEAVDFQCTKIAGGAELFQGIQDDDAAERIARHVIKDYASNLMLLIESDREKYWGNMMNVRNLVFSLRKTDTINGTLYDFILQTKGILLGANTDTRKLVEQSGNPELVERYKSLLSDKHKYDEFMSVPEGSRKISVDSLRVSIDVAERRLSSDLQGLIAGAKGKNWEDIRDTLEKKEVAVEFYDYLNPKTMETCYVAMIIRNGAKAPELVDMGSLDGIRKISSSHAIYEPGFKSEQIYDALWAPLLAHVKKGDRIYYSPSGIINNINLSAICGKSGKQLGKLYDMVRCSSTEYVISRRKDDRITSAALWGGLEYGKEGERTNDKTRSGWSFLPGSLSESSTIATMLKNTNISCTLYQGEFGDEASFKSVSGIGISTLHLSTHGFYIPVEKAYKNDFVVSITGENSEVSDAMIRCGLMMAGGNGTWISGKDGSSANDGVMTAREIANLDLSSVDLVVLSACETALGDITSDGVLGLQRAFKNAGAGAIVMSLWKVDDEATQMLMTEFYSNMIEGNSIRASFNKAVLEVKNKYEDPYYWAAFIKLD